MVLGDFKEVDIDKLLLILSPSRWLRVLHKTCFRTLSTTNQQYMSKIRDGQIIMDHGESWEFFPR